MAGWWPAIRSRCRIEREEPVLAEQQFLIKRWLGKTEQGDKWRFCLNAAKIAADQERNDDETDAPESHTGIQGEGGVGGAVPDDEYTRLRKIGAALSEDQAMTLALRA